MIRVGSERTLWTRKTSFRDSRRTLIIAVPVRRKTYLKWFRLCSVNLRNLKHRIGLLEIRAFSWWASICPGQYYRTMTIIIPFDQNSIMDFLHYELVNIRAVKTTFLFNQSRYICGVNPYRLNLAIQVNTKAETDQYASFSLLTKNYPLPVYNI